MKCTIIQDKCGFLYVWKGCNRKIIFTHGRPQVNKIREDLNEFDADATLFFQREEDVQAIEETLKPWQLRSLNNGYKINAEVDDLYFENE